MADYTGGPLKVGSFGPRHFIVPFPALIFELDVLDRNGICVIETGRIYGKLRHNCPSLCLDLPSNLLYPDDHKFRGFERSEPYYNVHFP